MVSDASVVCLFFVFQRVFCCRILSWASPFSCEARSRKNSTGPSTCMTSTRTDTSPKRSVQSVERLKSHQEVLKTPSTCCVFRYFFMLVACRDNIHEAKTSSWALTGWRRWTPFILADGIWAKLKAAGRVILGRFCQDCVVFGSQTRWQHSFLAYFWRVFVYSRRKSAIFVSVNCAKVQQGSRLHANMDAHTKCGAIFNYWDILKNLIKVVSVTGRKVSATPDVSLSQPLFSLILFLVGNAGHHEGHLRHDGEMHVPHPQRGDTPSARWSVLPGKWAVCSFNGKTSP